MQNQQAARQCHPLGLSPGESIPQARLVPHQQAHFVKRYVGRDPDGHRAKAHQGDTQSMQPIGHIGGHTTPEQHRPLKNHGDSSPHFQ